MTTMAKWYVNYRNQGSREIETIDEFDNYREAKIMLREYREANKGMTVSVWLSKRATKDWYASKK